MSDFAQQVFSPLLRSSASGGSGQRFLVVPGGTMPRWLLPCPASQLDSVLRNWSPYRFSSRLAWYAVRAADRIGGLPTLPGVGNATVNGFDHIDWCALGWSGSEPPVVAAYVGTPGAARKAVLHLIDSSCGECTAILKLPLVQGARNAIVHEAEVLKKLELHQFAAAPRLLFLDRARGISTQTALNGSSAGRELTAGVESLLRSLLLPGRTTTIAEHAAVWQEQLRWTGGESDAATINAALARMCDQRPLPACWVHGDFAPWNLKQSEDGSLALLDWEEAQGQGLPLLDAFHFLHVQDYLFGKSPASHAAELLDFAGSIAIAPEQCHRLEVTYLAFFYLRCLARQEAKAADFLWQTLRLVL